MLEEHTGLWSTVYGKQSLILAMCLHQLHDTAAPKLALYYTDRPNEGNFFPWKWNNISIYYSV